MVGTNYSLLLLHGDSFVMVSIRFARCRWIEFIWTRRSARNRFRFGSLGMPWGLLGEQTLQCGRRDCLRAHSHT